MAKSNNGSWQKIFDDYKILEHNFNKSPFLVSAQQIKKSCQGFKTTGAKEVRILCKQDSRESRPRVFVENNLFILPIKNGQFVILKGDGYVNIPKITSPIKEYDSKLDFNLDTSKVGNSEMQHLDFAYASSLIRTFIGDPSLVLTIRGRKYTPKFEFKIRNQKIEVSSVQTEVDAGYEGRDNIVLVEAKNSGVSNTIIRQLYFPFRQWQYYTKKKILTLFFEKSRDDIYSIWQFEFKNRNDYNSISLVRAERYRIV